MFHNVLASGIIRPNENSGKSEASKIGQSRSTRNQTRLAGLSAAGCIVISKCPSVRRAVYTGRWMVECSSVSYFMFDYYKKN